MASKSMPIRDSADDGFSAKTVTRGSLLRSDWERQNDTLLTRRVSKWPRRSLLRQGGYPMKTFLGILLLLATAAIANAGCIKCDQSTGYWCFMRFDGTKSGCDSQTNAGCITWGTCTPSGQECDGCEEYPVGSARPFTNNLRIASVSITVPMS